MCWSLCYFVACAAAHHRCGNERQRTRTSPPLGLHLVVRPRCVPALSATYATSAAPAAAAAATYSVDDALPGLHLGNGKEDAPRPFGPAASLLPPPRTGVRIGVTAGVKLLVGCRSTSPLTLTASSATSVSAADIASSAPWCPPPCWTLPNPVRGVPLSPTTLLGAAVTSGVTGAASEPAADDN